MPSDHIISRVSLGLDASYVPSSITDETIQEMRPQGSPSVHSSFSAQLKYSFQFSDPKIRNYYPGGYQGIGVGIYSFGFPGVESGKKGSRYIGNPFSFYVFQGAPFYSFGNSFSLNYEWQFGASFGWKPYSDYNRWFNLNVGSKVNAYLNIGFYLNWNVSQRVELTGGLSLSHFSNGNTSWPNPGVNSVGVRVGMIYYLNRNIGDFPEVTDTLKKKKLDYDISLWVSARKRVYKGGEKPVLLNGRFGCAGIGFAPMVKFGRWVKTGGSLDLQWDESSDLKKNYIEGTATEDIKFYRPSVWHQLSLGISAHAELQMPVFALNVGIGYNIVAHDEKRCTYQNLNLKTYLWKKLYLNVGYQLRNFSQQSNLMLGFGMTL